MELVHLLASVRRHVRLILLVGFITSLAGLALAQGQTSSASASSRIVLGPAETILEDGDRIDVGQVLNRPIMAANLSEIVVGDRVLEQARQSVALTPDQVGGVAVDATIAPESNVITITVSAADAAVVGALIQPLTDQGIGSFEGIYPLVRAEVIDLDTSPDVSEPAGPLMAVIVGLIVGLILAVFLGLLLDAMKMPPPALVRDRGPWLVNRVPEPTINLTDVDPGPVPTIGARYRTIVGFDPDAPDVAADGKTAPKPKTSTGGKRSGGTKRAIGNRSKAKTNTGPKPPEKTATKTDSKPAGKTEKAGV